VTSSVPVFSLACCILGARLRSSSAVRARSSCSRFAKRFANFALSLRTLLSLSLSVCLSVSSLLQVFLPKSCEKKMASESREENVYVAKLAEQAERYDEMVEAMEKVAKTVDVEELTVEERNLLSVAYKNVIGARRASWRIISSIEQKEESKGNEEHVAAIRDYRAKVEQELSTICDSILNLLNTHLIPTSSTGESKVFYLKMKGDYHRYLAEFKTGAERKEAAESTLLAYKSAQVSITSSRCTL